MQYKRHMTDIHSRYIQLVGEIFEKHPTVQKDGFTAGAYKPGLQGMEGWDEVLGHPWRSYRTLHVAGTNGKGSVSSMLAAALSARGKAVGLYTSPHLVDFRERMKVIRGGSFTMPEEGFVVRFLEDYSAAMEGLSFFEITTGMAFKWFEEQGVDAAVIETGLGGRLDSTNIIIPEVSVVTSIGLDHCALLGDTRAKIAAEKAGIFKKGVPAVVGTRDDQTAPVFEEAAARIGAELHFADDAALCPLEMDLQGEWQAENLRTALTALHCIGIDDPDLGAVSRTARITGLRGRWEYLGPDMVCDIGHNPPALEVNFRRLEESGKPITIVYGVMADKDLDGIAPLMPSGAHYILCAPATTRALPAEKLSERLSLLRPDLDTEVAASVAEAVETARKSAKCRPGSLIYIGGSTFVVAEAMKTLEMI